MLELQQYLELQQQTDPEEDRQQPPRARTAPSADREPKERAAKGDYKVTQKYMKKTESSYDISYPEKHGTIMDAIRNGYTNLLKRNNILMDYWNQEYHGDMKIGLAKITKDTRLREALTCQVDICLFLTEIHYVFGVNAWPPDEKNMATRQIYNLMCMYDC